MPILKTERLILRPFQVDDLEAFATYRSDPEVARYQGWNAPYSREAAAAFIAEMKDKLPGIPGDWYQFAIQRKDTPGLIGDCVFHILADDLHQATIGYSLARPHQGQGYAREAVRRLLDYLFQEFDLHRITATCDALNLTSARLLEDVGMRREAHHIENIWFKGAWGSEYVYAMLRREWLER